MNIDGLTDAQKNNKAATACGWVEIHERAAPWLGEPAPLTWCGKDPSGRAYSFMDGYNSIPNYCENTNAHKELFDNAHQRGFDVVIRRHNGGPWKVEFCEPSHEISATNDSLPRAVTDAFLLTLP